MVALRGGGRSTAPGPSRIPARSALMSEIVMARHGGAGAPQPAARAAAGRRRVRRTARQRDGAAAAVKRGGGGSGERGSGRGCAGATSSLRRPQATLAVRCSRSRRTGGAGANALNGTGLRHRDTFTGAVVVTVPVADRALRRGAPLGTHSHDASRRSSQLLPPGRGGSRLGDRRRRQAHPTDALHSQADGPSHYKKRIA